MNSENVKLSARNEVASKAALDNINRALTGTAPAPQSTRRQRVVRDSVSNTRSGTSTDSSQQPRGLPDPSHDTASSLTEKGSTYATPGVRSPVVEPSPEILNYITSTVTSQGSLEAKSVDARSYAASSVKSSHVTTAKTPFSSTDANINPPHFERPSSAVPSQNLSESITFNPNTTAKSSQPERLPSVAPTQKLSKWDLFTQINDFPSGPQTHSVTSYVSSTRPTYQELVAAQNKSPILESIRDHETKIAATSNEPMSSGVAAKSAKADAPFPCSYDDCSMGFNDITALKNHKYLDHEGWCKLCDVDTDDYKALLEHKKDSLRHVVCQWCGKDFRSGSGRDLHERQEHSPETSLACPGCHYIHNSADSFVNHMVYNLCKKPRGLWCERTFRQNRALAALKYDEYLDTQNQNSFTIDESDAESDAGESSIADGVPVHGSLLDSINEEDSQDSADEYGRPRNIMDDDISTTGDYSNDSGSDVTAGGKDTHNEDPHSSKHPVGYGKTNNTVKGLEGPKMTDGTDKVKGTNWSKKLFPDAKPTPAPKGFMAYPRNFEPDRNPETRNTWFSTSPFSGPQMSTDWDYFEFQRDINGHFRCPFESCTDVYPHLDQMKFHLTSNMHFGVDYQCPKCFHRFDDDYWNRDPKIREIHKKKHPLVRLAAHLTSNSVDCAIKRTKRFGHIFHMLTGGYLGIVYDEHERVCYRVIEEPSPELPIGDDYDELDRGFRNW